MKSVSQLPERMDWRELCKFPAWVINVKSCLTKGINLYSGCYSREGPGLLRLLLVNFRCNFLSVGPSLYFHVCRAFAATAVIESHVALASGLVYDLSPEQVTCFGFSPES